ncbi:MAG: hypothetical protein WD036_04450 [Bauldia sp.]
MRRWVVTALVAVFALGSLLHGGLIQAAPAQAAGRYAAFDQHGDGVSGKHTPGVPWNRLPGQLHDGQVAGCTAGGCALCGVVPMAVPIAPKALRMVRPDLAGSLISLAIAPPLRPPTLHA